MINRLIFLFRRILVGCMVILLVPTVVCAQDSTPITLDLIVTMRDVHGAPLAGLTVQIRASVDSPLLAQMVTNAQGQALFAMISVSQMRVRVLGTLASGAQLYQPGADAPGIAVFLGPPPTTLDLRVDSDGMVLPDPTTMIDPLPHGPVIATPAPGPDGNGRSVFPTSATYAPPVAPSGATSATTAPMTSTPPTSPLGVAPPADVDVESSTPTSASLLDWLVGITGVLALAVCSLLLIRLRGRRRL